MSDECPCVPCVEDAKREETPRRLVLARDVGERLIVSGPCVIEVKKVAKGRAVLLVEAPWCTKVLRSELRDARGEA